MSHKYSNLSPYSNLLSNFCLRKTECWMARPRLWESVRLQLLGDEVVLTDNVVEDDVIGTGSNLNVSTILDTDAYGEAL